MRLFTVFVFSLSLALQATAELAVKTVYQFAANDTWLENLRTRSNGIILATQIGPPASAANLLAFDPRGTLPAKKVLVYNFPHVLGISGLTEGAPDIFYHVWRVDFPNDSNDAIVTLIARPQAPTGFNGLATFNASIILASVSYQDSIFAVNVKTGYTWEAIKDSLMSNINGLKVSDGYVYWSSDDGFCRAPLFSNVTAGAGACIVTGTFDDFAIAPNGYRTAKTTGDSRKHAYGATAAYNTIEQISFNAVTGEQDETAIIAGSLDSTEIAEPTACMFGRGEGQLNKLYVTTGGGSGVAVDVNGTDTVVGAQLLEIQLDSNLGVLEYET